ncbi:hypothetical protein CRENBAI_004549 [Crenichthys baileyi]|uniref:Uncharacterized protein n=1 Tax=Crenichthys baileyi TaxID=28760 RepID=A0AAV9SM35_9TELE
MRTRARFATPTGPPRVIMDMLTAHRDTELTFTQRISRKVTEEEEEDAIRSFFLSSPPRPPGFIISERRDRRSFTPAYASASWDYPSITPEQVQRHCESAGNSNQLQKPQFTQLQEQRPAHMGEGGCSSATRLSALLFRLG